MKQKIEFIIKVDKVNRPLIYPYIFSVIVILTNCYSLLFINVFCFRFPYYFLLFRGPP